MMERCLLLLDRTILQDDLFVSMQRSQPHHSPKEVSKPGEAVRFLRRLGPDPHANGAQTPALCNCPDLFELDSGDFAVIGIDITDTAKDRLPPSASCGPDERIVWIPRRMLVLAKPDIPDSQ